jgi:DNA-binding transcriptional regulator YhcF (GntR family)
MIEVDTAKPAPLYLQISEQLARLIVLGAIRPGERLPAVRELAVQSRVNRNTAARAIQHLEARGLVRTRVGQGTFVTEPDARPPAEPSPEDVFDASIDRLLVDASTSGFPLELLEQRVIRRIEQFRRRQQSALAGASEESR